MSAASASHTSDVSSGPPPKKRAPATRTSEAAIGTSRIARIAGEATIPRRSGRPTHKSLTARSYARRLAHRRQAFPRLTRRGGSARARRRRLGRDALLEGPLERLVRRPDRQHLRGALLPRRPEAPAGRRADVLERTRRHPARAPERGREGEEGGP